MKKRLFGLSADAENFVLLGLATALNFALALWVSGCSVLDDQPDFDRPSDERYEVVTRAGEHYEASDVPGEQAKAKSESIELWRAGQSAACLKNIGNLQANLQFLHDGYTDNDWSPGTVPSYATYIMPLVTSIRAAAVDFETKTGALGNVLSGTEEEQQGAAKALLQANKALRKSIYQLSKFVKTHTFTGDQNTEGDGLATKMYTVAIRKASQCIARQTRAVDQSYDGGDVSSLQQSAHLFKSKTMPLNHFLITT